MELYSQDLLEGAALLPKSAAGTPNNPAGFFQALQSFSNGSARRVKSFGQSTFRWQSVIVNEISSFNVLTDRVGDAG